ncbi:MarR family winged helix-turn-helix transcriptional regulator [Saccharopolyspora phatthalungensis]|uniref:DNA-binding MarR family transcriptional regulator n=1 Tax=Saccharopolyspora phatthalungensis TaxID=664693 RepID=A0A840QKM0_9PSEU|nr:MarR family winged helix-turn-helix transcriptional regulator [Saccharopolyspora phatthalungensis]MBB5159073.1 DNA-binding MarR family transcriptional regulator [Saccharopolyspora phatthalungensis]
MTSEPATHVDELADPGLGGPVSQTLARIARLHRVAGGRLLRPTSLCSGQEFLMMFLWNAGTIRQPELTRILDLDPSTVTLMLQRLEQGGHVTRSRDPLDRRVMLVQATPESYELRSEVANAWTRLEELVLDGFDGGERDEFARLLAKVEKNLRSETEGRPEPQVS